MRRAFYYIALFSVPLLYSDTHVRSEPPNAEKRDPMPPWLKRWARPNQRNNPAVLVAFKDVVHGPRASTVQVYCGQRQVAFGTIVDKHGLILTKASELVGEIECVLPNGKRVPAERKGEKPEFDLAVLKVDAHKLRAVRWGNKPSVLLGSWVAAPGGSSLPVAIGVVSSPARRILKPRPILGVRLSDSTRSPVIAHVFPHSGAATAGLKQGDVIERVGNKPVRTGDELVRRLAAYRPGDRVPLQYRRDERVHKTTATLADISTTAIGRSARSSKSLGRELSKRHSDFPVAFSHDGVLRPNECGGPLVDLDGICVGINIAAANRVATLAIPASAVQTIVKEFQSRPIVTNTRHDELRVLISRWSQQLKAVEARRQRELAVLRRVQAELNETQATAAAQRSQQRVAAVDREVLETRERLEELQDELSQLDQPAE